MKRSAWLAVVVASVFTSCIDFAGAERVFCGFHPERCDGGFSDAGAGGAGGGVASGGGQGGGAPGGGQGGGADDAGSTDAGMMDAGDDGGLDAGALDAGVAQDAGTDAGLDAGAMDAGALDAGQPLPDGGCRIDTFTPRDAPVGGALTLNGVGLRGAISVTIGASTAVVPTVLSDGGLLVLVPPGSTEGLVSVTTATGACSAPGFVSAAHLEWSPTPLSLNGGCAQLAYTVAESHGDNVDLIFEFDPTSDGGSFQNPKRCTQAGSTSTANGLAGIQGVQTSDGGVAHRFLWNAQADGVAGPTAVRVRTTSHGVATGAQTMVDLGSAVVFGAGSGLGPAPRDFAIGDVNRDGRPDVIALSFGNTLDVYLQATNGFASSPNSSVALVSPTVLAVGDLDLDGRLDVAVANGAQVTVFLGTLVGTFGTSGTNYGVGGAPTAIAIEDVTHDGRPDVVVLNTANNNVQVLDGLTFSATTVNLSTAPLSGPEALAIADLDGDSALDFVVATTTGITVAYGPSFAQTRSATVLASTVHVADLDGDRRFEIVATSGTTSTLLRVELGGALVILGALPGVMALVDVNADGRLDALGSALPNVGVALGLTATTFEPSMRTLPGPFTANTPSRLVAADFNRDGRSDLLFAGGSGFATLLNQSRTDCEFNLAATRLSVVKPSTLAPAVTGSAVVDFDGDARLDVVIADRNGRFSTWSGLGNGALAPPGAPLQLTSSVQALAVADLDGDQIDDVVAASQSNPELIVLHGARSGLPRVQPVHVNGTPRAVATGDFDGDARLDLVSANANNTVTTARALDDGGYDSSASLSAGFDAGALFVFDFTGDQRPDVVLVNDAAPNVSLLRGLSNGAFQDLGTRPTGLAAGPVVAAAGPLRVGEPPSVVLASLSATALTVMRFADFAVDGGVATASASMLAPGLRSLVIADDDLDGVSEIFGMLASGGSVRLAWNGTTYVSSSVPARFPVTRASVNAQAITVADLDADGRPDEVMEADWLQLACVGAAKPQRGLLAQTLVQMQPAFADFNGDGRVDLSFIDTGASFTVTFGLADGGWSTFAKATNVGGPVAMAAGDLNGDGRSDGILAAGSTLRAYLTLPDAGFAFVDSDAGTPVIAPLVAGRVTFDGLVDVVGSSTSSANLKLFRGLGDGGFAAPTTLAAPGTAPPKALWLGDIDGDRRSDVVEVAGGNTAFIFWGGDAGTFTRQDVVVAVGVNAVGIAAGDIDRNGTVDLVFASLGNPSGVVLVLNQGSRVFMSPPLVATLPSPSSVQLADMNRDGFLDLISLDAQHDLVGVSLAVPGASLTFVSSPATYFGGVNPSSVYIDDLNRDGRLDLLVYGQPTSTTLTFSLLAGQP